MKNKTKGLIAGVAGIALLTGGSTFAVWSSSTTVAAAEITNGDLQVSSGTTPATWADVSSDRTRRVISAIGDFSMVPGDTVEYVQPLEVSLKGDNLTARVTLDAAAIVSPNLSVTYRVEGLDRSAGQAIWKPVGTATLGAPLDVQLYSPENTVRNNDGIVVGTGDDLRVVAAVTLPSTATAGQAVQTQLPALTTTVTQVRQGAGFTS